MREGRPSMDVDDYAGQDGLHACFNDCMRLAGERALDDLMVAVTVKAVRTKSTKCPELPQLH